MRKHTFAIFLISAAFLNFNIYSQSDLLNKAYKMNSAILLNEFMYNWERNITPISYDEFNLLSDTIQEVYIIAESFYDYVIQDSISQVLDTAAIRHDSAGYIEARKFILNHIKYFSETKYFIFPFSITYSINYAKDYKQPWRYYSLLKDSTVTYIKDKITNFRPRLDKRGIKSVYLTDDYFNTFKTFIGRRYSKKPTESNKDFLKKEQFLSNVLKIVCGGLIEPSELYPHCLLTFPVIETIYIKNSFLEAKVIYYDGCAEYEAYMKKINGKWEWLKNTLLGIC